MKPKKKLAKSYKTSLHEARKMIQGRDQAFIYIVNEFLTT